MKHTFKLMLAGIVLNLGLAASAFAVEPINTYGVGGGLLSEPPRTGVAIKGYDPVAYFKASKPVLGSDAFVMTWKGAKWKFSSQDNLNAFKENPEKFAPQFGGYCAYGVSQGHTVKTEPDQWSIVDGKLYLNYNADVAKMWNKDRENLIKTANEKFSDLLKK